ncbi:MAG: ribonuclease P protein component [Saprospiraceae bacterium]|nr:ribonuclease P protein component [Saprospiraceae bacterium]
MGRTFTFPSDYRLKSRKKIEDLFRSSRSVLAHPVLFKYQLNHDSEAAFIQVAFSISKKSFKKAVDRNQIKRRMREAYRLNWKELLNPFEAEFGLNIMLIYLDKEIQEYAKIEASVKKGLLKIADETRSNKLR